MFHPADHDPLAPAAIGKFNHNVTRLKLGSGSDCQESEREEKVIWGA